MKLSPSSLAAAVFILWSLPHVAWAEVKLNGLFADNLVLQRGRSVPVWGTAGAGEKVTVEFAGQLKSTTAAADGTWRVNLDALAASTENRVLTVRGDRSPSPGAIKDVLVGEVWLCSGQSNMEWALSKSDGGAEAIAQAGNPLLRLCRVPHNPQFTPQASIALQWQQISPKTVKDFSAVPYWFGEHLQRALGVPVGIINSAFGGTGIQAWMSAGTLAAGPWPQDKWSVLPLAKAAYGENYAKVAASITAYETARAEALKNNLPPSPKPAPTLPSEFKGVTTLWNGETVPLLPFALRGIAWYQGESNAYPGVADTYRDLLPALLKDWRSAFEQPTLPIIILQIARNRKFQTDPNEPSGNAVVQEAQLKTALSTAHTALVVTNDKGGPDVHYTDKKPIALRTVSAALALAYGQKIESAGPVFRSLKIEGSQAMVSFDHASGGLIAQDGPLQTFVIAGSDQRFFFAEARIEGSTVVVSSPQVPAPVAVRYGWADLPKVVNLYNGAGFPAPPFRTDDWPLGATRRPSAPAR